MSILGVFVPTTTGSPVGLARPRPTLRPKRRAARPAGMAMTAPDRNMMALNSCSRVSRYLQSAAHGVRVCACGGVGWGVEWGEVGWGGGGVGWRDQRE